MNDERQKIDVIDCEIMAKLDERFHLVRTIGQYKQLHHLPIVHEVREQAVLKQAAPYLYEDEIQAIYQTIFAKSRALQAVRVGLVGKSLPYTLSPMIYQAMGFPDYQIIETNDLKKTLEKGTFQGLNVTIPYKEEAYRYCEQWDESAEITKVVNTVIGKKGYNTDYLAMIDIFLSKKINFQKQKVVIIGNGATARSVKYAILDVAKRTNVVLSSLVFLVRTPRAEEDVLLKDYMKHTDATMLINTTPYGMAPDTKTTPLFPIDQFHQLQWVMDVVYNPLKTPLLCAAKKQGISIINGFHLLLMQAAQSATLIFGQEIDIKSLYQVLIKSIQNIVLIGMPFSGKTHLGIQLGEAMHRTVIDFDQELQKRGQDLSTLLRHHQSVADFRKYEIQLACELMDTRGAIIVPGGGIVLSDQAMDILKRNALVVFVDTPLDILKSRIDGSRPLIQNLDDLDRLYRERRPLYEHYADMMSSEENGVLDKIYENLYY
ncbi:MAG: shikimate kinase [Bacilli bacterium]